MITLPSTKRYNNLTLFSMKSKVIECTIPSINKDPFVRSRLGIYNDTPQNPCIII